ncbi:hypothetical protein OZ999_12030 [Staphylococcus pseudintermedius]|nr:hypothetical protein [Staphylococcus pseudintermedius]EHT3687964.1 hypothetical protein [Staphylococcus pseudintermedius]EIE3602087.1 hypothetical protein [Staphylococcus pseudintermedius]EIE3652392.1 hypothetical protein [Staphylococcus pseudintermedius]EIE3870991.1 hypothetical protein [Staphylococcus pseudintermedius]EJA1923466.1 hypothetical protein [Staphylococcus pseudintermedius]
MNKLQVIKIALLIVILAEEIRNARDNKKFVPEDSRDFHETRKPSMKNPN